MYEAVLARVALFHDLSPRELTWLSGACHERTYAIGEFLARAGGDLGGLCIVLRGSAQVTPPQSADGQHTNTQPAEGWFGPGAVIGEMALFAATTQRESIEALEPTTTLSLPRWDFQATLRESPDIAIKLLDTLSQRLHQVSAPAAPIRDVPLS